ncbi:Ada metal-binding domain-containing protein [Pedobacter sp. SG908]|uniref:Ada metal-binding domain-containing protein n=1 Tax=Pedobacter sp. SG908 TaxID=2587135 RepID=UPI00141F8D98|nr:Ada metal-binding domain-containing protein [Pedobacter sp. SG908]NII81444.1 methylphosphotriester-DNA--protein-cysteine methyltransferase [Pedobacter sp. SG908]
MIKHADISTEELKKHFKNKDICFGGNARLKIYGLLKCKSGKRMKKENRIFFRSVEEAIQHGYRPCGRCLRKAYQQWIYSTQQ